MPIAKVGDIRIHYLIEGQGPPLLMIMGFGASSVAWSDEYTARFTPSFRTIRFDNRGTGLSDKPDGEYSIRMMAEDAAGLLRAQGIEKAHVFGVSMGGMIAQELALRHPQRVRTLILGSTSFGGPNAVVASTELMQSWAGLAALPVEQAIERGLTFLYSDGFIARMKEQLIRRGLALAHLRPPLDALLRQFAAVSQFDAFDRLSEIRVPTLILTGSDDKIVPAENSRILAERIPSARLVIFEGAGHGYLVECAEESNAVVLDFLRRHSSGTPK